jgi:hypothetical protein
MRFAPYNGSYPGQAAHFKSAGLIADNNHWRAVFDFNDDTENPTRENWDYVPEAEWAEDWLEDFEGEFGEVSVLVRLRSEEGLGAQ